MTQFIIKTPSRAKPIGKPHATLAEATKAAIRAARRLDSHVTVHHWRGERKLIVFSDGTTIEGS